MFGLLKTRRTPEDAVGEFIVHLEQKVTSVYEPWQSTVIEGLVASRVPKNVCDAILKQCNLKRVFFCGICALEALAIRNSFPRAESEILYKKLFYHLASTFDPELGKSVFALMENIDRSVADDLTNPAQAISGALARYTMGEMKLDDFPEAQELSKKLLGKVSSDGYLDPMSLSESPFLVLIVGGSYFELGLSAWWKTSGTNVKF